MTLATVKSALSDGVSLGVMICNANYAFAQSQIWSKFLSSVVRRYKHKTGQVTGFLLSKGHPILLKTMLLPIPVLPTEVSLELSILKLL